MKIVIPKNDDSSKVEFETLLVGELFYHGNVVCMVIEVESDDNDSNAVNLRTGTTFCVCEKAMVEHVTDMVLTPESNLIRSE